MKDRVLFVDDDADQCELIEATLSRQGLIVKTTTSATEALDLVQREEFDVVLTDLGLNEMSGIDLSERILGAKPDAVVIVVTGLVRIGSVSRDGKAVSYTGLTAGAWFGEGTVLKNEARRYDVEALRDTRLAIMVLPAPGGPTSSRLCAPADAISSARRASSCPRTSARSCISPIGGVGAGTATARGVDGSFSARTASASVRARSASAWRSAPRAATSCCSSSLKRF